MCARGPGFPPFSLCFCLLSLNFLPVSHQRLSTQDLVRLTAEIKSKQAAEMFDELFAVDSFALAVR